MTPSDSLGEPHVQLSGLTRVIHGAARLAGVGASFGIGIGTCVLGDKAAAFAANNAMSMSARMVLLKWLFGCLCLLPAVVAFVVSLQIGTTDRVRRFENVSKAVAPLTGIGLAPLLFHSQIWKGKVELFLLANLLISLLVWRTLRNVRFRLSGPAVDWLSYSLRRRLPTSALPWVLLAVIASLVLLLGHGLSSGAMIAGRSVPSSPLLPSTTLVGGLMKLGHGGVLGIPFVKVPWLQRSGALGPLVVMGLTVSAAFSLFAWSRLHLGTLAAGIVALLYLSFPHLAVVGSTAPLPLGAGAVFFFGAAWAVEKRRFVVAAACCVLLLMVHEQAALWLVCLGAYLAYRRPTVKGARLLVLLPLIYFVWVALVALPGLHIEAYTSQYRSMWNAEEPGLVHALTALVKNPAYALLRLCGEREAYFWLLLLVPFALLPLANARGTLWLLPFIFFGVVSVGHFPREDLSSMSVSHFVVLGFAATVLNLAERKRASCCSRAGLWQALLTFCFALSATVFQIGCFWLKPL